MKKTIVKLSVININGYHKSKKNVDVPIGHAARGSFIPRLPVFFVEVRKHAGSLISEVLRTTAYVHRVDQKVDQ